MPRITRAAALGYNSSPSSNYGLIMRHFGPLAHDVLDLDARLTALEGRIGAGVVPGVGGGGAPEAPGPAGGAPRSRRSRKYRKNRSSRKNNRRI